MRFLTLFLCFSCFVWLLTTESHAQRKTHYPIGKVVVTEGHAFMSHNPGKSLKPEDPIFFNSVIQTGENGKIMVLFIDDTQITLAENSELTIDEYVFDPYEAEENKGEFSVTKGAFHWVSGMISQKDVPDVNFNTAFGSIGIRGTEFWAGEINDGFGVAVDDGEVGFAGEGGSIDLPAGTSFFIGKKDDNPQNGEPWNRTLRENAFEKVTFANNSRVEERLETFKHQNIQSRHDYRGQMFPYKENPYKQKYRFDEEDPFTEEFRELQQRN